MDLRLVPYVLLSSAAITTVAFVVISSYNRNYVRPIAWAHVAVCLGLAAGFGLFAATYWMPVERPNNIATSIRLFFLIAGVSWWIAIVGITVQTVRRRYARRKEQQG
jgi:hypothetical protein